MYVRKREASFKNYGIPKIFSFPQHSRQVPTSSVLLSRKSAQVPILTAPLLHFSVWHRPWRRVMTPFCYISVLRNQLKVGKLRYLLAKVFLGWDSVPQNWRAIHDGLCISFRMESSRVWQYLLETKTGISGQVWGKDTWSRQWTDSERQVPVKVSSATYASAKLLSPDTAESGFFFFKSRYMSFIRFPEHTSGAPGICSAVLPGSRGIFIRPVCWHWVTRSVLPSLKSFMASSSQWAAAAWRISVLRPEAVAQQGHFTSP